MAVAKLRSVPYQDPSLVTWGIAEAVLLKRFCRWTRRPAGQGRAKGPCSARLETSPPPQPSCASVDLQGDSSLQVEISDAVSERDKVKFTVQTKVRQCGARRKVLVAARRRPPPGVVGMCQHSLWALFLHLALALSPSWKASILTRLWVPLPEAPSPNHPHPRF